jgi:hypothetical protein
VNRYTGEKRIHPPHENAKPLCYAQSVIALKISQYSDLPATDEQAQEL